MFYVLFVRKKIFHLNIVLRKNFSTEKNFALPPIKNMEKLGKIGKKWHRGNFSSNVVISETGCGNFP
jgi:hypothetical protein